MIFRLRPAAILSTALLILMSLSGCADAAQSQLVAQRQARALGGPGTVQPGLAPCPSGTNGPLKVFLLAPGYEPTAPNYQSPTSPLTGPNPTEPSDTIKTSINAAFALAPPTFKAQLCSLTAIFINQKDCGNGGGNNCTANDDKTFGDSWGYRENPSQGITSNFGRYIALSGGLWPAGGNPPAFSAYIGKQTLQLVDWTKGNPPDQYPPTFGAALPKDTPEMTILAALAHEFGHVLWYDTFVKRPGGRHDFTKFCKGTFFIDSWQTVDPPPDWRNFGDRQNEPRRFDAVEEHVGVAELALSLMRGQAKKSHNHVHNIYRPEARWPSLFAALSPDEDFVETFVFWVMLNQTSNPLAHLPLTIYDTDGSPLFKDDIAGDYGNNNKPGLAKKIACFN
jgi:hypothetical protein